MNKKYVYIFLVFCAIILYIYIGNVYVENQSKEIDNIFTSANINGEIEKIDYYAHGTKIKIKDDKQEYVFYPKLSINEERTFDNVAEPGDRVVKPAYAPTLKLYHKGKLYEFEFYLSE